MSDAVRDRIIAVISRLTDQERLLLSRVLQIEQENLHLESLA